MPRSDARSEGSYASPSYERASASDAMRHGVISCAPETPLRQVARIMSGERIHCVVVSDQDSWGVVNDLDLLGAADVDLDSTTAGEIAAGDLPTVGTGESLEEAARLMLEHEVAHVLVLDGGGRPAGVLSSLDIAGVLAWGRA